MIDTKVRIDYYSSSRRKRNHRNPSQLFRTLYTHILYNFWLLFIRNRPTLSRIYWMPYQCIALCYSVEEWWCLTRYLYITSTNLIKAKTEDTIGRSIGLLSQPKTSLKPSFKQPAAYLPSTYLLHLFIILRAFTTLHLLSLSMLVFKWNAFFQGCSLFFRSLAQTSRI